MGLFFDSAGAHTYPKSGQVAPIPPKFGMGHLQWFRVLSGVADMLAQTWNKTLLTFPIISSNLSFLQNIATGIELPSIHVTALSLRGMVTDN